MTHSARRAGALALIAGGIAIGYGLLSWQVPQSFLGVPQSAGTITDTLTETASDDVAIDIEALYRDARIEFQTASLANGLKIVVIEDHRAPVVTHMVWYNVGAADEDPGASGLAHFLEHLMFKGTQTRKAGEFSDIIAAAGGQENAFTSQDYTGYYQKIAKQHLPIMMALEADRMTGLAFNPDEVLPERDVVQEERRQRTDTRPDGRFGEELNAALYLNHPYSVPIIGWEHELAALTPQAALAFYKRHYGPDNATLIVAGDTSLAAVVDLAQQTYGKLAPIGVRPRMRPQEPPHTVSRRLDFSDPRLAQDRVVMNWLVPSYNQQADDQADIQADPYALALLAEILGGGTTSRLYQNLVVNDKVALGTSAWYAGLAYDAGEFAISVTAAPKQSLETVQATAVALLGAMAANGISEEELHRAKLKSLVGQIYAKDNVGHLARMLGASVTTGLSYDEIRNWPDRMKAVTATDIQAAANWLQSQPNVIGYLRKGDAR